MITQCSSRIIPRCGCRGNLGSRCIIEKNHSASRAPWEGLVRRLAVEHRLGESDRYSEIGTAKIPNNSKGHADHLSVTVDQRSP
jgi:hypothetical protein